MTGIVMGLKACAELGKKLIEIMEMQEKQNKKAMSDKIVFRIPNGYEIDYEQSNDEKLVYKKKEKYEPKEGDLVVFSLINGEAEEYIGLWKCNPDITPSLYKSIFTNYRWTIIYNSNAVKGHILRPATAEEASLFISILVENGYEYDPEKKEVRKKRWRAEKGKCYKYVSIYGYVSEKTDYRNTSDDELYRIGNYFRTREEAEEVSQKFKEILKNR